MGKETTLLLREMEVPHFQWELDYHFVMGKETTLLLREMELPVSMEMGLPLCHGERDYTTVEGNGSTTV